MSEHHDLLLRLFDLAGIAPGFRDQNGQWNETSVSARCDVLKGFGIACHTYDDVRNSVERLEALREGLVPPLLVASVGHAFEVRLRRPGPVRWVLEGEAGSVLNGEVDGETISLPPVDAGYYTLTITDGAGTDTCATLICAPERCYLPPAIEAGKRMWGVVAQVYGLRGEPDMGIGGYAEIARAAEGAGKLGADFLGLSPLHALFESDRSKYSPYSPSSRLFLESLHIDIASVPGFAGSEAEKRLESESYRHRLKALSEAPLVDHEAVWTLKRPLLDLLFEDFLQKGDERFDHFRKHGGEPLERHAAFEALSEHFHAEGRLWMGEWPQDFRSPSSDVVAWFCEEKAERVTFHIWLQWLADIQLEAASERAMQAGMGVGLYRDLAVGADRGGSEVWAEPDLFSPTLSVGAPPDPLGPQGQNWGLPPLDPFALERHGLKAFRALVQANMRHAGAIRIDHAFQLQRLFVIPEGKHAADGAYIAYPFEAMLAVLRLESHRAQCVVIAEDLGTAPEGFSDAIMRAGLLSYRVLYFERAEHGRFKPPSSYPRDAMAVFTTHDLPTLRGWWRGLDVDLRQTLGVFDAGRAEHERGVRGHDVYMFCEALKGEELFSGDVPPEPPMEATVRFIARTPSVLAAIQFEDIANELNQANMPGLTEGHPNWRRRLPETLDALTASDGQLARWAALMAQEGRGGGSAS